MGRPDHDQRSSRERLLKAAKALFSEQGYEATTSAAIARLAKTSQSQFMKHFSSKQGVLAEICDQAWKQIADAVGLATTRVTAAEEKLKLLINIVFSYLERDPEFRRIWLEHKSYGGGRSPADCEGYSVFTAIVDEILHDMDSSRVNRLRNASALRSGFMGALFGMLGDIEAQRSNGLSAADSEAEITAILLRLVAASRTTPAAQEARQQESTDELWVDNYLDLASKVLGPRGTA